MTSTHHSVRADARCIASALALVFCLAAVPAAHASKAFKSAQAAMEAFGEAVGTGDEDALKEMLGANFHNLIPPVGTEDRYRFLEAWARSHVIEGDDGKVARIAAGGDGWTLPIPLVKAAAGWQFDTTVGAEEMRIRRIGRNELAAQQTLLAIFDAQREYASEPRDRDGLLTYAKRLTSTPGRRDGLYWPTKAGEAPSLLGPTLAAAGAPNARPDGYHGYHYKLLTKQGTHAPGGALDYVVRDKLLGGFAILAWPARYWDTGVMSFIVNHDGQVYERDLGPASAKKAAEMAPTTPAPAGRRYRREASQAISSPARSARGSQPIIVKTHADRSAFTALRRRATRPRRARTCPSPRPSTGWLNEGDHSSKRPTPQQVSPGFDAALA